MHYEYLPENVCTQKISFDINDDKITNIQFTGGCNGNLKAISKLLEGSTIDYIHENLLGNTCGRRPTSCADQLAKAVIKAQQNQN